MGPLENREETDEIYLWQCLFRWFLIPDCKLLEERIYDSWFLGGGSAFRQIRGAQKTHTRNLQWHILDPFTVILLALYGFQICILTPSTLGFTAIPACKDCPPPLMLPSFMGSPLAPDVSHTLLPPPVVTAPKFSLCYLHPPVTLHSWSLMVQLGTSSPSLNILYAQEREIDTLFTYSLKRKVVPTQQNLMHCSSSIKTIITQGCVGSSVG